MVSGADLRQALQAGLWAALTDSGDRAAMRATCRDACGMADALHDAAVLPVGPEVWERAADVAAYHRRLGSVQSLHVQYSAGAEGEAHAALFVEAYAATPGAALPDASTCSIGMGFGTRLPPSLMAVLLQRVVPRLERLRIALGHYGNLEGLLALLEPCTHLHSLSFVPAAAAAGSAGSPMSVVVPDGEDGDPLAALCRLTRLHTLSGPLHLTPSHLQRLCGALPSLTALGFRHLDLSGASAGACISRQLTTLAAWCHGADADSLMQSPSCWHGLVSGRCLVGGVRKMLSALPAVQHLDALALEASYGEVGDAAALQAAAQRFSACAGRWAMSIAFGRTPLQHLALSLLPSSLEAVQHLSVDFCTRPTAGAVPDAATVLGCLAAAAPNIVTLKLWGLIPETTSKEEVMAMMRPLRAATRLHTLYVHRTFYTYATAGSQAALLEGTARSLAAPAAAGGGELMRARALRRVLMPRASPAALAACRAALAADGIHVAVAEWVP